MRLAVAVAAAVLAAACGSPHRPAPPPPGPGTAPATPVAAALTDPGMRLPRDLDIRGYDLDIKLDPAQPTLTGIVTIRGELVRTTDVIWLHGEGLVIGKATASRRGVAGGDVQLTVISDVAPGKLALRAASPMVPGPLTITIAYTAPIADTETAGTFHQKVGDDWYAYTQHEAISARRSFPCLDEPDLKVPWQVKLTVPAALTAVANAPEVTSTSLDERTKVIEFAPTEAIPSYLVAYAVGPFDVVPAGKSASGVPLRIFALKGRGAEARYAAEVMPKITSELERWFDMPHPFPKLDTVCIPATVGFGAMENPGMITYRESLILLPPDVGQVRKARLMGIAAHEIAHQWFGNLVTPRWWDDIWLNESFASWLPDKILVVLEPGWRRPEDALDAREEALAVDILASTRRVRQPIAGEGDIVTAFDRITYAKGAAILRLFEARLGADRFQAGVRAYIKKHARGNATAADFLAALDEAAPDAGAGAAVSTLIDQAGAPRLTATLECPAGGQAGVRLKQERFVPPGAGAATPATWKLPVCLKAGGNGAPEEVCTTLDGAEGFVPLAHCATWVWPNAGGLGYWRTTLDRTLWQSLRTTGWKKLTAAERVALAQDLFAAVGAGDVDVALALELVPLLVGEGNRAALATAAGLIERVEPWVPAPQRKKFEAWVLAQVGKRARELGWLPAAKDDLQRESSRSRIVPVAAVIGADPALSKAAVRLARDWRKVPDAARGDVLVAAVRQEPALTDALIADFRAEPARNLRSDLARAVAAAPQPGRLEAALALLLDAELDIRDTFTILTSAVGREDTRPTAEAFAFANVDALIARLPGDTGTQLINVLIGGCDLAAAESHRALVEDKLGALRGARRRIDQAFERVSQCDARKKIVVPALEAFFKKR